mmetsp:Transcript_8090/g.36796  ORF Transcript_8090/g.36796 Transcript_8090/m.36796 type:complete len:429 (+) Transcript_8090:818-2104(+)
MFSASSLACIICALSESISACACWAAASAEAPSSSTRAAASEAADSKFAICARRSAESASVSALEASKAAASLSLAKVSALSSALTSASSPRSDSLSAAASAAAASACDADFFSSARWSCARAAAASAFSAATMRCSRSASRLESDALSFWCSSSLICARSCSSWSMPSWSCASCSSILRRFSSRSVFWDCTRRFSASSSARSSAVAMAVPWVFAFVAAACDASWLAIDAAEASAAPTAVSISATSSVSKFAQASTNWSFLVFIILNVSLDALMWCVSSLRYASPSLFLVFGRKVTMRSTPPRKAASSKIISASSFTRPISRALYGVAAKPWMSAPFWRKSWGAMDLRLRPLSLPLKLASLAALLGAIISLTLASVSVPVRLGVRDDARAPSKFSSPAMSTPGTALSLFPLDDRSVVFAAFGSDGRSN